MHSDDHSKTTNESQNEEKIAASEPKKQKSKLLLIPLTIFSLLIIAIGFLDGLKLLPKPEQAAIEIAKQQLIPDPNTKIWIDQDIAQEGPKTKAWTIELDSFHAGPWTLFMCEEGISLVSRRLNCVVASKSPEWNLVFYNSKTRSYFLSPLNKWKEAISKAVNKSASAQPVYKSLLLEKTPTKMKDGIILGHRASQYQVAALGISGVKKVEFWTSNDLEFPLELRKVVSQLYGAGLLAVKGIPLKASFISNDGTKTPIFSVTKLEEKNIPLAYFDFPADYKRVDSEMEVLLNEVGRRKMDEIMQGD